jgi:hypothetical protein
MKLRADTIIAAFVVALFASFLTALAVLLVRTLAVSTFKVKFFGDIVANIYILFFLSGFVFFKGSSLAAWLVYRHDVAWGYKLEMRKVMPIFLISFGMATAIFFAVQFYITSEVKFLAYLEDPRSVIHTKKGL